MSHLELYHHFSQLRCTNSLLCLATPEHAAIMKTSVLEYSVQLPYLMHQLLAISARHKSRRATDDDERASYLQQALQLQTHAITIFHASNPGLPSVAINPKQSIPTLCFATMLGTHALCDTLTALDDPASPADMDESSRRNSLQTFLTRWVDYARLHRSVNNHVLGASDLIHESEMRPLLQHGRAMSERHPAGHHTDALLARIATLQGLSPEVLAACLTAVDGLQVAIDIGNDASAEGGAAAISPEYLPIWWALTVPDGFLEALSTGLPELVAVMAYYAVLLHRARASWAVGGAGTKLLQILTAHLGIRFTEVLAYPRKELGLGHFDAVYDAVRGWTERSSP